MEPPGKAAPGECLWLHAPGTHTGNPLPHPWLGASGQGELKSPLSPARGPEEKQTPGTGFHWFTWDRAPWLIATLDVTIPPWAAFYPTSAILPHEDPRNHLAQGSVASAENDRLRCKAWGSPLSQAASALRQERTQLTHLIFCFLETLYM